LLFSQEEKAGRPKGIVRTPVIENMAKDRKYSLLLALEIGALSSFLWQAFILKAPPASIMPRLWAWSALFGITLLVALGLSLLIRSYTALLASRAHPTGKALRQSIIITFAPLILLGLTFVQRLVYLKDIDRALLLVSGFGVIVLQVIFLSGLKRTGGRDLREGGTIRRLSVRLFLLALLIYALYLSGLVFPAQPFTGDEPHYLLITKSLLFDGDLNLANNYRDKDYAAFYDGDLDAHAHPGIKGEQFLYSWHFPALPILILPFYAVGERIGGTISSLTHQAISPKAVLLFFSRFPLCLLTALLGLLLFLSVWKLTQRKTVAVGSWLIFSFTAPVLFYSHLIYPEIPVAVILLGIFHEIIQKKRLSAGALFWSGAGIGVLPWFGIKYIFLALPVFIVVLFVFLKRPQRDLKKSLYLFAPVFLSAGLFLFFLFSVYGSFYPQSVYLGAASAKTLPLSRLIVKSLADFVSLLLGYLFDQRVGVFIYSPVYMLAVPGFLLLFKRKKKEAATLAVVFAIFWILCASTFYWGGYCPPGRPLLPVVWILAVFWAEALSRGEDKKLLHVRNFLIALSFFLVLMAVQNPKLLYHESLSSLSLLSPREITGKLLAGLGNLLIDWTKIVPSLSNTVAGQKNWIPLIFWLLGLMGITAISLRQKRRKEAATGSPALSGHLALIVFLSLVAIASTFFSVRLERRGGLKNSGWELVPQDENSYDPERGGFWVRGDSRSWLIIMTAGPISEVRLSLQSPVGGKAVVWVGGSRRDIELGSKSGNERTESYFSPLCFPWKGSYLYSLQIEAKSGFYPYSIDRNSKDKRHLGVFVRIDITMKSSRKNPY